jgi:leader peptidase (prepilin peptidase)/N-methyltransferase
MIAWYHNIPLVSYIALRARCAYCGARIRPRYVLVELLVAVLFLLVWMKFVSGPGPRLWGMAPIYDPFLIPVFWLVLSGLVLGTFVDFEHLIIPDRVTLGGIVAGVILSMLVPELHGRDTLLSGLIAALIGAATGWGMLWTVAIVGKAIFRKEAMGFGDVKLMGAIGAFFGWQAVLFTIVMSSLAGSIVGIVLVLSRRKELQSRIPYGPYISLGALVWLLWGPALWNLYINLLRP